MAKALTANQTAPIIKGVAVTPNDSTTFAQCRGLFVGGTGNIVTINEDSTNTTYINVPVGIFPVSVIGVKSTSTTATSIVALY